MQHPLDFPVAKMATVDIHPGTLTTISIDPKIMVTEDFVIENFSQDSRNCFAQNELKFETLPNSAFRYSYDNCIVEGVFMQVMQECGCQRAMGSLLGNLKGEDNSGKSGKRSGSSNLTLSYNGPDKLNLVEAMRTANGTLDGCYGKKLFCYLKKWKSFGKILTIKDVDQLKRDCQAACKGVTYAVHGVSTAAFPSYGAFMQNKDLYCLVYRKLLDICLSAYLDLTWWEDTRMGRMEDFFRFHFHTFEYFQDKFKLYGSLKDDNGIKYADQEGILPTVCNILLDQTYTTGTCLSDAQKYPMLVEELKSPLAELISEVSGET